MAHWQRAQHGSQTEGAGEGMTRFLPSWKGQLPSRGKNVKLYQKAYNYVPSPGRGTKGACNSSWQRNSKLGSASLEEPVQSLKGVAGFGKAESKEAA